MHALRYLITIHVTPPDSDQSYLRGSPVPPFGLNVEWEPGLKYFIDYNILNAISLNNSIMQIIYT